jgi:hypothetical protein
VKNEKCFNDVVFSLAIKFVLFIWNTILIIFGKGGEIIKDGKSDG